MKPKNDPGHDIAKAASDPGQSQADAQIAARRRFLRMGAGGTAALVVTVTHKRAFAGIKKGLLASRCTSLQGVPDLKHSTAKNPLQVSAMGTPKGAICRPRPPIPDPNALGNCTVPTKQPRYFDSFGNRNLVVDANQLDKGCGDINTTINAANPYRLYEKGYCPIKFDGTQYTLDLTKVYYTRNNGVLIAQRCIGP